MKTITTGSDFSGIGAFDYAINRIAAIKDFEVNNVFACDMDKYARISYLANHKEPGYYPLNVYDREIPKESLDVYMTSPPCQSFSLAGKRLGKDDKRGVLFFNSHEFIQTNKPRFFIFENVKGLLSDDNGKTFSEWINMLGGKSVNGNPVIFPYDNSVPYHVYYKVLNSKKYGVPQNRERIFIIGIRDDEDNVFSWPQEEILTKKLRDVLESNVDEKYFLSQKMIDNLFLKESGKDGGYKKAEIKDKNKHANALTARMAKMGRGDHYIEDIIQVNNPKHSNDRIYSDEGLSPTLNTMQGGNRQPFIQVNSIQKVGFINQDTQASQVFSENGVSPTIAAGTHGYANGYVETICIPVLTPDRANKRQNGRRFKEDGDEMFTLTTQDKHGVFDGFKIRKLTPLECSRLQDFPDIHTTNAKNAGVSDSQLYKQAGNSITVGVLEKIISKLKL